MTQYRRQQPQHFFLLIVSILLAYGALWTAWPGPASKPNPLGYYSQCSWAPFSTLFLAGLSAIVCSIRKRAYRIELECAVDAKNSTIG